MRHNLGSDGLLARRKQAGFLARFAPQGAWSALAPLLASAGPRLSKDLILAALAPVEAVKRAEAG